MKIQVGEYKWNGRELHMDHESAKWEREENVVSIYVVISRCSQTCSVAYQPPTDGST